jgi:Tol biopolymer transport system component
MRLPLLCVLVAATSCRPAPTAKVESPPPLPGGLPIERVSVSAEGAQSNRTSRWPALSADGRDVAFQSLGTNLVSGFSNDWPDVFVRTRDPQATEGASQPAGGAEGIDGAAFPSISADGRYVAFQSFAANLVADDTNGLVDVFVFDRQDGSVTRVSVATDGTEANGASSFPSISADGRFVAFNSLAGNLTGDGQPREGHVFLHDRVTRVTERVDVSSEGVPGDAPAADASPSADGRLVVFASMAGNLVAGDTNVSADVFVRDREAGRTERVSLGASGEQGNDSSGAPSLSPDGRWLVFASHATNLTADGARVSQKIYVRDLLDGVTDLVSGESAGLASVSADGRFVAFASGTATLVPGDTNLADDVFVFDRRDRRTVRVSVSAAGVEGDDGSGLIRDSTVRISANGRYVGFASAASNLVDQPDTNGPEQPDVYVAPNPLAP